MNNIRMLRKQKGIQQKELALALNVSNATVSDWELGKKEPSKERVKQIAEYFGVEERVVTGDVDLRLTKNREHYIPQYPKTSGVSETEQIIQHVLEKLGINQPQTEEARIISGGIDKLPKAQREQALAVMRAMFAAHAEYFEEKGTDNDT